MKNSKHISVFNDLLLIVLALLLILYTKSLIILIICSLFIIYRLNYKSLLLLLILLSCIIIRIAFLNFDTSYYYVKNIKENKIIASNLLNDVIVYTNDDFRINEIIKIEGLKSRIKDENKLVNNQIYEFKNSQIKHISRIYSFRSYIYDKHLMMEDQNAKALVSKVLFKIVDYNDNNFVLNNFTFSYYFIFKFILKLFNRIKYNEFLKISFVSFIFISIFGFNYTVLRIISLELFLIIFKRRDIALSFGIIFLIFYNPYSIKSYAFIVPYLLRISLLFKHNLNFKAILMLIESYFFNEVKLFIIIFYKYIMYINMIVFILSIIIIFIPDLSFILKFLYNFILNISFINISIKGKISIFYILFYYLFIKYFKLNYNWFQNIFLILLLVSNISSIMGSITFIDVGQGDAILIKTPFNQENILIDTGTKFNYYKLKRSLNAYGVYDLDYLILTHSDKDHSGAIYDLFNDYDIKKVITDHQDIKTNKLYLKSLNENIYDNPNDNSLVYYLKYNDLSFLFTGDISKRIEEKIIHKYPSLKVDILKLSHHGSKTGTSIHLLNNYDIKIGIISTSGMYNHPHEETINSLNKFNIKYYSTKEKGNITFYFLNLIEFINFSNHEFVIIR